MITQAQKHVHTDARRRARGLSGILAGAAWSMAAASAAVADDGDAARGAARPRQSSPIAITADGLFVWAVNPDHNTVSVIRTDMGQRVAKIPVGKEPRSIALSPDGRRAYVANAADNTVSVIRIADAESARFSAAVDYGVGGHGQLTTGAEPRALVVSPDGNRVYVANRSQDTISVISAQSNRVVGSFNLNQSACNMDPRRERHFQPASLAITGDGRFLLVTQYLSYTSEGGVQASDVGKEGIVCRLSINPSSIAEGGLSAPVAIQLAPRDTGIPDPNGNSTYAFPNQLQSIALHGRRAYFPNVAASPGAPLNPSTDTEPFVNVVGDIEGRPSDLGAVNLNLGGRIPESGKPELYFANPNAIAFTTAFGAGYAYVASGGSDVLVKLRVGADESLSFTANANTTRYIDLNNPDNTATNGINAGKNPIGVVINAAGTRAYTLNYVSRNISVVDLTTDSVLKVIATEDLPEPGSQAEKMLVGAEVFFSSRGNFVNPTGVGSSRNRMSVKGRQDCASCHPGGLGDGVVWRFNTGPRKTLGINGTFNRLNPQDQRILNASAIFDEVEDADLNTRNVSGGGLLAAPAPCVATPPNTNVATSTVNPDYGLILGTPYGFAVAPCVVNAFTTPNARRPSATVHLPGSAFEVSALDAIVMWQHYGIRTPNRPMTRSELLAAGSDGAGGLNEYEIGVGRRLFAQAGCVSCHSGGMWSISARNFVPPPAPGDIATEAGAAGVNQAQYLWRFLRDVGSFDLNTAGSSRLIPGYPPIGGKETDTNGAKALGFDYNGDGKGSGFSPYSILGTYNAPPYFHNGACETLECVLADANHRSAGQSKGGSVELGERERRALVQFLKSLDATTPAF